MREWCSHTLDTNSAIWYNRHIMERFQRAKLERQVADVRRELWSWVATYREMASDVNKWRYDQKQLDLAEQRALYLEDVADHAERLEELLAKASVP
jgi:Mg2+ and Co2+ transporter CorA